MAVYRTNVLLKDNVPVDVAVSQTEEQIGTVEHISGLDSRDLLVLIRASNVVGAGSIKMQHAFFKQGTFEDVAGTTATINADMDIEIEYTAVLGTDPALRPFIRLVATTGGGDSFTVDGLYRTHRM